MAEPVLDNDEIKKRATRRLFVAVVLVGLAAGILTWLSQYKPSQPITTKPTPDTVVAPPIISPEPAPIVAAPAEPPPLEQMPPTEAPAAAAPAPAPVAPLPTLGAPPPPRVVSKPLPPPGPGPKATAPETGKPLVKAESAPPAPAQPAPMPPAPAPSGYVVQFGVFANPKNALQLVERLKQAGIAAQTETRVQLPPFKTKAEAEAALAKLKEKGISAVVVAH